MYVSRCAPSPTPHVLAPSYATGLSLNIHSYETNLAGNHAIILLWHCILHCRILTSEFIVCNNGSVSYNYSMILL